MPCGRVFVFPAFVLFSPPQDFEEYARSIGQYRIRHSIGVELILAAGSPLPLREGMKADKYL